MSSNPTIRPEPESGAVDRSELEALERRRLEAHADIRERLARLETNQNYWATKENIQGLKVWVLGGTLAAMFSVLLTLLTGVALLVRAYWGK